MAALLLPTQVVSLSGQAVQRLLEADNGDAALLYLALAENGNDEQKAADRLRWTGDRFYLAREKLAGLELVSQEAKRISTHKEEEEKAPEYSRGEVAAALARETNFKDLLGEMERLLGRVLNDTDLKTLYTMYDYLGLSAEMILTITTYTIQTERRMRKSSSWLPRLPRILKEAKSWKAQGVDTEERGEEFLRKQQRVDQREWEILSAVGVAEKRPAVSKEREFIGRWIEKEYSMELIRLAYERTVFRKGSMNWAYMGKILENWEKAGYRNAQDVALGEGTAEREVHVARGRSGGGQTGTQPSAARIQNSDDWMDRYLEGGTGQQGEEE